MFISLCSPLNFLLSLTWIVPTLCLESDKNPIVELPNGKVRGLNRGKYLSFESIPYAEPPIGRNRFEAPKPYTEKWSDIRDATQTPVRCIQWDQLLFKENLLDGVEDCLVINVYTPSLSGDGPYPVLVLIHGGAFMFGGARNNGQEFLMDRGKLVVVTMNYRLGPLGFLSTGDGVITGNFGLKDQLLALEWTKTNVATFNGNPEKITVIGFSSGGASVHLHMMNTNFENLAKSAVSMSGTALSYWSIDRRAAQKALAMAKYLNCPTENSSSIKKCLQKKDATDIVLKIKKFQTIGYNPTVVFGPVVEPTFVKNAFLTAEPEFIIKSGKTAQIPWLVSTVMEEGGYNAADFMRKNSNGVELIEVYNERWNEFAPRNLYFDNVVNDNEFLTFSTSVRQKYMGNHKFTAKNYLLMQKMYTDILFHDGVKKTWNMHHKYSRSPIYGYVYDNAAPTGFAQLLSNRTDIHFGTVHGDDYYLIFKNPEVDKESFSENQIDMSKNFVKMIENFSYTRNLQFGNCSFEENTSRTKDLRIMHITKDSCRAVDVDAII